MTTPTERRKLIKQLEKLLRQLEVSMDMAVQMREYDLVLKHVEAIRKVDQKIEAHQRILDQ